jgi:predicted glycogen debranching enzyme
MFSFGREACNHLPTAEKLEWLATNGIGGYACGTVSGLLTRRYHGLLVAALQPPLGRTLLLAKLDEAATYRGQTYLFFANRWADGTVDPQGFQHIERFHLEGTTPVWTYACADALLEKRIWMKPYANTTYIHYTLKRGTAPITLTIKTLINSRDYHASTSANHWRMQLAAVPQGFQVIPYPGATPFYLLSQQLEATLQHSWYRGYFLSVEAYRGLDAVEDHLHAGDFRASLSPGESLTLVASTDPRPDLDGQVASIERQAYEQRLINQGLKQTGIGLPVDQESRLPERMQQLVLAASQFVVRRPLPDGSQGCSIIAGYPWFGDWGRDTMIALPGLTLCTGQPEVARTILQTYARYVDEGMLPNRFPDSDEGPEYNTVDAALWYFRAVHQYFLQTGDTSLIDDLFSTLVDILNWYRQGTRYNIHVDPKDGLLYAGEPGFQLTWMDAKIGGWVITPRIGKPVEINALWHNALRVTALFSEHLGKPGAMTEDYIERANFVAENFRQRFWYEAGGYLCDVIDGPGGDPGYDGKRYDRRLRPNQIFAVSLPFDLLNDEQARSVIDICAGHLLTPYGLRSLAPNEPAYVGSYGGDQFQRDAAYHQGTVWAWLLGPFVRAHFRIYQDPSLARSFLLPLIRHLASHCIGNISEIFDGDPPFSAHGSMAQAWSVAEILSAWYETGPVRSRRAQM